MLQPASTLPSQTQFAAALKKVNKKQKHFVRSLHDYIFNDGKSGCEESSCDLVTTSGTHRERHVVQLDKLFCDSWVRGSDRRSETFETVFLALSDESSSQAEFPFHLKLETPKPYVSTPISPEAGRRLLPFKP